MQPGSICPQVSRAIRYLLKKKVALACRHLRENRLPLKEIALASGFSDQSHLGRISNILNTTPAQYRKGESVRLQELEQAYS